MIPLQKMINRGNADLTAAGLVGGEDQQKDRVNVRHAGAIASPTDRASSSWTRSAPATSPCRGDFPLSPHEKRVARALCSNRTFAEIAGDLGLKHKTVKNYAHNIYRLMGARSREHLAAMLLLPLNSPLRNGLVGVE